MLHSILFEYALYQFSYYIPYLKEEALGTGSSADTNVFWFLDYILTDSYSKLIDLLFRYVINFFSALGKDFYHFTRASGSPSYNSSSYVDSLHTFTLIARIMSFNLRLLVLFTHFEEISMKNDYILGNLLGLFSFSVSIIIVLCFLP